MCPEESSHIEDTHAVEDVYIRVLAAWPSWSEFLDIVFVQSRHAGTVSKKGQWIVGSTVLKPCHAFCMANVEIAQTPLQTRFADLLRLSALRGAFSAR